MPRWLTITAFVALCAFLISAFGYRWLLNQQPPALDPHTPLVLQNTSVFTHEDIRIQVGAYGIPTITANTVSDLVYGLGFMHGRDRGFQLDVLRHLATGTLSQLLGAKAKPFDERFEILTYHLKEQYDALDNSDKQLLEAYSAGVNAGIQHAGNPLQLTLLRKQFPPFTPLDSVAIARLQAWDLAYDLEDEIVRYAIADALPTDAARAQALSPFMQADGLPIVPNTKRASNLHSSNKLLDFARLPRQPPQKSNLVDYHEGASNSWVISGAHTQSGHPILCNDPHLLHRAPSIMYLARFEHPDFTLEGATFGGLPAVLMGHSNHMAFGVTASFADVQDLVPASDESAGPLLPAHLSKEWAIARNMRVKWTGFTIGGSNRRLVSGFWQLAMSHTIQEAEQALELVSFAGINVVLANIKGDIAYRLAANSPKHHWPMSERPSVTNPPSGVIVAANQRVVDDQHNAALVVGHSAQFPYRALRIQERINELLKEGKEAVTLDALMAIQQDVLSIEARKLLPIVNKLCHDPADFCKQIEDFDGQYTKNSLGALPFTLLLDSLRDVTFTYWLTDKIAPRATKRPFAAMAIENALVELSMGHKPIIFYDAQGNPLIETFMQQAIDNSMEYLQLHVGASPHNWRWGTLHTLQQEDPLAAIPVFGNLFKAKKYPQSGYGKVPRAEQGLPVKHGAALRMCVEMSNPPIAKMVLDLGNSGHILSPHFEDQAVLWNLGKSIEMSQVNNALEGVIILQK